MLRSDTLTGREELAPARAGCFQGWIEVGLDLLCNRRKMLWKKGRLRNRCRMMRKVRFAQGEYM